jgi:hypothetical protein
MNQVVQIYGGDFATLPPFELRPKLAESISELSIVSDGRPFSNQPLQGLRRIRHGV